VVPEISSRTDRHTDRQTQTLAAGRPQAYSSHYFATAPTGEVAITGIRHRSHSLVLQNTKQQTRKAEIKQTTKFWWSLEKWKNRWQLTSMLLYCTQPISPFVPIHPFNHVRMLVPFWRLSDSVKRCKLKYSNRKSLCSWTVFIVEFYKLSSNRKCWWTTVGLTSIKYQYLTWWICQYVVQMDCIITETLKFALSGTSPLFENPCSIQHVTNKEITLTKMHHSKTTVH